MARFFFKNLPLYQTSLEKLVWIHPQGGSPEFNATKPDYVYRCVYICIYVYKGIVTKLVNKLSVPLQWNHARTRPIVKCFLSRK